MKRVLALVMTLGLLLSLTACGGGETKQAEGGAPAAESDLAYIKDKGEMVVGMTLFAPMNYEENGELTGFETEFATAVCEKLGVTPKFQEIDWNSKEIELNAKNIDCIWNGMTVTEDRKQNMALTDSYMNNKQVIVCKKENVDKFANSVDGLSVVAENGSTGEELAQSDAFFANANYTAVDSQAKGLTDVLAGTSDAAIVDYVLSIGSIGEGTDFKDLAVVESKEFARDEYAVAFRKGSDVADEVNKVIAELAADGTLKQIADKYKLGELLLVK